MSSPPMIVVVAHRRRLDTVLGEQLASMVYDGYLSNLREAGASAVIAAPGTPLPETVIHEMDGLLLTGGGDIDPGRFSGTEAGRDIDPERDSLETELVNHCHGQGLPVLGICRGNQMLNVALGGTLRTVEGHVQGQPLSEPVHELQPVADCRLATLVGTRRLGINSFHRWAVADVAPGLRVTARTSDGVVEGVEWVEDDWFAVGVQWHVELLDDPHVAGLFGGFVEATRRRVEA